MREESIWNEIISSCLDLASTNAQDVRRQLEFSNVDYLEGMGTFTGLGNELQIETCISKEFLRSKSVLIATGSSPFRPKNIPFDGERVFDSDSINGLSYLPKSIAITGSGIIAIDTPKFFVI